MMNLKMWIGVTVSLLATVLMLSTLTISQEEALSYRPCGEYLNVPDSPWKESFDASGSQMFCYYNDSVIFIRQDLKWVGGIFTPYHIHRSFYSDSYIENIGFIEPLGTKIRTSRILFDYYFPYCDGTDGCPNGACPVSVDNSPDLYNRQIVLIGDWDANFSIEAGVDSFNAALDDFTAEAVLCGCGTWCHYEYEVQDAFKNDWGSSFNNINRDLGTFGLEVANVYLANLKVIGSEETVNVW